MVLKCLILHLSTLNEDLRLDPLLKSTRLLNSRSWLYFRLYKDPASNNNWQNILNWYHETLINVIRPVVNANSNILAIIFGLYGPERHAAEEEIYEKIIEEPDTNIVFIRLRVAPKVGKKNIVKSAILAAIRNNRNLIWDYETMVTYNINADLGPRFGSNNIHQTLGFIRYWEAGCRYILSIIAMPGNWIADVDVWGIPHLINNSIGTWLRQERPPQICPNTNCGAHMYMNTIPITAQFSAVTVHPMLIPSFVFICPNCQTALVRPSNI